METMVTSGIKEKHSQPDYINTFNGLMLLIFIDVYSWISSTWMTWEAGVKNVPLFDKISALIMNQDTRISMYSFTTKEQQ